MNYKSCYRRNLSRYLLTDHYASRKRFRVALRALSISLILAISAATSPMFLRSRGNFDEQATPISIIETKGFCTTCARSSQPWMDAVFIMSCVLFLKQYRVHDFTDSLRQSCRSKVVQVKVSL